MTRSEAFHWLDKAISSLDSQSHHLTIANASWALTVLAGEFATGVLPSVLDGEASADRARFDRYVCAVESNVNAPVEYVVDRAAELYAAANAKWEAMNSEAKGEQP